MLIKRKAIKAEIIKPITPHTFRRSLATNLYNRGGKLETIQKQLGHSNVGTTMGYIHNDFATLYADYSKIFQNQNQSLSNYSTSELLAEIGRRTGGVYVKDYQPALILYENTNYLYSRQHQGTVSLLKLLGAIESLPLRIESILVKQVKDLKAKLFKDETQIEDLEFKLGKGEGRRIMPYTKEQLKAYYQINKAKLNQQRSERRKLARLGQIRKGEVETVSQVETLLEVRTLEQVETSKL
ncbi:6881_t:CDS:2 [Entrophospora sp. SA101]|nr:6881_t:CDS:2 [Entrophospora sp. SA101]